MPAPAIAAGQEGSVTLELPILDIGEACLTASLRLKKDKRYAARGHEVAFGQGIWHVEQVEPMAEPMNPSRAGNSTPLNLFLRKGMKSRFVSFMAILKSVARAMAFPSYFPALWEISFLIVWAIGRCSRTHHSRPFGGHLSITITAADVISRLHSGSWQACTVA